MLKKASVAAALCCLSSVAVESAIAQVLKPAVEPAAPAAMPLAEQGPLGPGWHVARPATITPMQAEAFIKARGAPPKVDKPILAAPSAKSGRDGTVRSAASSFGAPETPADVTELALALKKDPNLIYQHVRNNIEFYPVWGVQKGAVGALIDGSGTAFDQALLLRDLLRAAGFTTAELVKGRVRMTPTEAAAWLGVTTANDCTVSNRFSAGGYGVTRWNVSGTGPCLNFAAVEIDHVWVRATINGATSFFDPSFKPRAAKAGISLATITGYTRAGFLTQAGGTVSAQGALTGINRANIRATATTYANNLATHIRTNNPHGAVHDVLGGPGPITPDWGQAQALPTCVPNTLPAARCQVAAPVAMSEGNATPVNNIDTYKATLRVQYRGIDRTFNSDAIYGKRLSLTFQATGVPQLWLDGVLQANGTSAAPANVNENVSIAVTHLAYTGFDQSFTQSIRTGTSDVYVISHGWGPSSGATLAHYQRQLARARASGAADGSEKVMGAAVAVLSAQWIAQVSASHDMLDRVKRQLTIWHHGVGIAGYSNATMYVDLPGNYVADVADDGSQNDSTGFYAQMFPLSVLESTSVQQVAGIASAASTVSLIDTAVANGQAIYNVTSANYGAVSPSFAAWGCSPYSSSVQSAVSAGRRVVLPANCALSAAQWSGAGYFAIGTSSITAAINGSVSAAATVQPTPPVPSPVFSGALAGGRGAFKASATDITVGVGEFPANLVFKRAYSSDDALNDSGLGNGWSHNLGGSARVATAGLRALGSGSALDAVANIVSSMVLLDLMADTTRPVQNIVAGTVVAKWAAEQLESTAVDVRIGASSEQFIRLPDGSYSPPRGSSVRLTLSAGKYTYETSDRTVLAFNTAGELDSYTLKNGMQAKFTYTGGRLTNVINSLGRKFELTYVGNRLDNVKATGNSADTSGRTVRYGYTGALLTSFTNALGEKVTYGYEAGSNRLNKVYADPAQTTLATLTNTYDSLGRLTRQTDAAGKITNHYFAGSRHEIEVPLTDPVRTVSYFNWQGLPVRSIDPVGRISTAEYDAAGRVTRTTFPERNSVEYTYDDVTCASAEKRCTNNVRTVTSRPKPGSTLPVLTTTNTYETVFNKLWTTTNPRGQVTTYTYHAASGQVASVTQPAAATGQPQPQSTFSYSSYPASQTGLPNIHLLTSETHRIDSATNITTTSRTYLAAAQSYVPATVVVDAGTGKLNLTTTFTYDAVGNLTVVDGPRTDVVDKTTSSYDALRRVTAISDALGKATRTYFDSKGRAVRAAQQVGTGWLVSCTRYTNNDLPDRQWGPALMVADTACPAQVAPAPLVDRVYDDLGRLTSETVNLTADEGGARTTAYAYFADGQIKDLTQASGTADASTLSYTYTGNGKRATLKDGRNNLSTYSYDGHDRLARLAYPVPAAGSSSSSSTDYEEFGYDNNGNVISHRRRNNVTVQMEYDNLDRQTKANYPATPADNVTYTYDLLGRRLTASRTDHALSYTWDNAGRMRTAAAGTRTLRYEYDNAGNRTKITWPDDLYVTTSYDALNRPTSIKENGTVDLVTSYAYDDLSRRTQITLGNGTTTTYTYGNHGPVSRIVHNLAGTANDATFDYTRNQTLDIATRTVTSANAAYRWAPTAAVTRSYTANGLNQYSAVAGVNLSYDARGNLTGDGTWTWTYDDANRLKTGARTGTSVALAYDGVGRMRQETLNGSAVTQFLHDDTDLVAEYNSAGTLLRRHVHGPGVDEPIVTYEGAGTTNKTWLYADHQGSIVAAANSAGAGTAAHSYGPFGEPNVTTGSRFKYTGQAHMPNLGLYYYKARFYSPALGRFLQPDPIGYDDGPNMYAYVGNNPMNRVDPTGLFGEEHHGGFGGVKTTSTATVNSALQSTLIAQAYPALPPVPAQYAPAAAVYRQMPPPGKPPGDFKVTIPGIGTVEGYSGIRLSTQNAGATQGITVPTDISRPVSAWQTQPLLGPLKLDGDGCQTNCGIGLSTPGPKSGSLQQNSWNGVYVTPNSVFFSHTSGYRDTKTKAGASAGYNVKLTPDPRLEQNIRNAAGTAAGLGALLWGLMGQPNLSPAH